MTQLGVLLIWDPVLSLHYQSTFGVLVVLRSNNELNHQETESEIQGFLSSPASFHLLSVYSEKLLTAQN